MVTLVVFGAKGWVNRSQRCCALLEPKRRKRKDGRALGKVTRDGSLQLWPCREIAVGFIVVNRKSDAIAFAP